MTTILLWHLFETIQMSRYQKKHSPIHTYPYHQPLSSCPSTMIHSILRFKFMGLTLLTVFLHHLSPGPPWSTSWSGTPSPHFILHTFLHPIIVFFHNTCPYHCNLFCCTTDIMSSIPSLSLNSLLGTLSSTLSI